MSSLNTSTVIVSLITISEILIRYELFKHFNKVHDKHAYNVIVNYKRVKLQLNFNF